MSTTPDSNETLRQDPSLDDGNARPEAAAENHEATGFAQEPERQLSEKELRRQRAQDRSAERARNLRAVFGSGPGKMALIAVAVIVLVFGALGVRGLNKDEVVANKREESNVPAAPAAQFQSGPISETDAAAREEQSRREAAAAMARGQSYTPDFQPNVQPDKVSTATGGTAHPAGMLSKADASQPTNARQHVQVVTPDPSAVAGTTTSSTPVAQGGAAPANAQAVAAEQKRLDDERKRQEDLVNKQTQTVVGSVKKQMEDLLGRDAKDVQGPRFTTASYLAAPKSNTETRPAAPGLLPGTAQGTSAPFNTGGLAQVGPGANAASTAGPKPVFKAGNMQYATGLAEINTDDGDDVIATVRGGPFDGSMAFGKIVRTPNNISLRFKTLAPQDDRPTMSINAIAIDEQSAKFGIAKDVDYHTLERYGSLFATSMLAGAGRAATGWQETPPIVPGGVVIVQQPELDNKRIALSALGELGTNWASEVRKNFNRPPTFSAPQNQGFVLVFLEDVAAPGSR